MCTVSVHSCPIIQLFVVHTVPNASIFLPEKDHLERPMGSRWLDYPLLLQLIYSLKCSFSYVKGKLLEGCQNWRCVTCVDPMLYGVCMADTHKHLSACPAYSGLADFGLEKTLPLYFVDEKHLVGM